MRFSILSGFLIFNAFLVCISFGIQPQSHWQLYNFPDGSKYYGEVLDGRMCGEGDWRGGNGDRYLGIFKDDVFCGSGTYYTSEGNTLCGTFHDGHLEGSGSLIYCDGRAQISKYFNGKEKGEGCRWSPCRLQAWRLIDGKIADDNIVKAEISLSRAKKIAASLEREIPPSIYALTIEGQKKLTTIVAEGSLTSETKLHDANDGALIAHSTIPLVDPEICNAIVDECENLAEAAGGWTTSRHANYPTTDIPLWRMQKTMAWFVNKLLPEVAYPFLSKAFAHNLPKHLNELDLGLGLRVVDAFVVKYNATAGQRELSAHRDGSVFSFNVALNDLDEYEEGGTSFRMLKKTHGGQCQSSGDGKMAIRSQKGHLLTHSSALMHAGHPINSGVRYLLVAFVGVTLDLKMWAAELYERITGLDPAQPEGG